LSARHARGKGQRQCGRESEGKARLHGFFPPLSVLIASRMRA
jgi:hypothetical protein